MTKIAVHSFKGGTGKSTITANLAVLLAMDGKNVGVMDLDLAGPGLHVIFQLTNEEIKYTLNDIFLGKCSPTDPVIDLSSKIGLTKGKLIFIPASYKAEDIVRVLTKGYELNLFRRAIEEVLKVYNLDYLFIDTHPGIEQSTLIAMGVCDIIMLVSRIDSQDIFGTGVMKEVARTLKKPEILVANMIPPGIDEDKMKQRLEAVFNSPVATALPFYTDVLRALSSEIFVVKHPDHDLVSRLKPIISKISALESKKIA